MSVTRRLWASLALLLLASFGVLLWIGTEISHNAPPMPERVVSSDGRVLYTRADIEKGRQVWQSIGGMQLGLNLTPLHGHTALFGVYGMLGIGLVLFCLRGLKPGIQWNERLLRATFWTFNIGLALMALLTLLPIGTMQLLAAIDHGYAYARSAEFMHRPIVELLVWMRVPGDTIFSIGAVLFTWFVIRLWVAPKREAPLPAGTSPLGR